MSIIVNNFFLLSMMKIILVSFLIYINIYIHIKQFLHMPITLLIKSYQNLIKV